MRHYLLLKDFPLVKAGIVLTFKKYTIHEDFEDTFIAQLPTGEEMLVTARELNNTEFFQPVEVMLEEELRETKQELQSARERGHHFADSIEHLIMYPDTPRSKELKKRVKEAHNFGSGITACRPLPYNYLL